MTTTTITPHAFIDSGLVRVAADGRRLKICASCKRPKIGTSHRRGLAPAPDQVEPEPIPDPELWELTLLRIALDRLLALPADSIGWRLRMRAADLHAALKITGDAPIAPELDPLAGPAPGPRHSHTTAPEPTTRGSMRHGSRWVRKAIRTATYWPIAERALDAGWQPRRTTHGIRFDSPDGEGWFALSASAADAARGYANVRSMARRAGLDVSGL